MGNGGLIAENVERLRRAASGMGIDLPEGPASVTMALGVHLSMSHLNQQLSSDLRRAIGPRTPFSMRMSEPGHRLLDTLSSTAGVSKSAIVELALREFAANQAY